MRKEEEEEEKGTVIIFNGVEMENNNFDKRYERNKTRKVKESKRKSVRCSGKEN